MWSVATEWKIYFVFPVLLWMRRRANIWIATLAAIVAGLLPHFLFPNYNLDWASPWFLGLFALGMLAAAVSMSDASDMARLRERLPWGLMAALLFAPGFILGLGAAHETSWAADLLVGASSGALLVSCARASRRRRASLPGEPPIEPPRGQAPSHIALDILSAVKPHEDLTH
jgi:peptidoglycan/LPS O-acetylase OafA/YrhL